MSKHNRRLTIPIFATFIVASLLFGWSIPAFYEWTGSDQSRPSPLIGQTALALAIVAIIGCGALPWLPVTQELNSAKPASRFSFTIRGLFALTSIIAVILAGLAKFPLGVSSILCAISFGYFVRFWIVNRHFRWPATALAACLWFPFCWIIAYNELDNIFPELLWMLAGLPALLPSASIGRSFGQNFQDAMWLPVLLIGIELFVGTWMIQLGPRRAIIYLTLVLLISTFGSLGFHAMVLM